MPETESEDTVFQDILQTKFKDIKAPPVFPKGHFVARLKKYTMGRAKSEAKTPFVNWEMEPVTACMDVTFEEGVEYDFSKKKFYKRFFITPDATPRLKKFLMAAGVPEESEDKLKEALELGKGCEVIVYNDIETNKQTGEPFNALGETFVHMDELDTING